MLPKQKLLNVEITNASEKETLEYIIKTIEKNTEKYYIVTPNPEFLVYANYHPEFRNRLNNARLALSDGMGVVWAGKFLGRPFKERVTGTDLVKNLCKLIFEKPITVGFLGGRGGVAEMTADCLQKEYPGLKVVFAGEEWSQDTSKFKTSNSQLPFQNQKLNKSINIKYYTSNSIDILFVAYGFPKQEEWIVKNLPKIPVKIAIGVGGAFDYISGNVTRAPVWIQSLGFEWLYRLVHQPWRIKRQLAILKFIWLVLKEKIHSLF